MNNSTHNSLVFKCVLENKQQLPKKGSSQVDIQKFAVFSLQKLLKSTMIKFNTFNMHDAYVFRTSKCAENEYLLRIVFNDEIINVSHDEEKVVDGFMEVSSLCKTLKIEPIIIEDHRLSTIKIINIDPCEREGLSKFISNCTDLSCISEYEYYDDKETGVLTHTLKFLLPTKNLHVLKQFYNFSFHNAIKFFILHYPSKQNVHCFKCLKQGHTSKNCTENFSKCFSCGSTEHKSSTCPKPLDHCLFCESKEHCTKKCDVCMPRFVSYIVDKALGKQHVDAKNSSFSWKPPAKNTSNKDKKSNDDESIIDEKRSKVIKKYNNSNIDDSTPSNLSTLLLEGKTKELQSLYEKLQRDNELLAAANDKLKEALELKFNELQASQKHFESSFNERMNDISSKIDAICEVKNVSLRVNERLTMNDNVISELNKKVDLLSEQIKVSIQLNSKPIRSASSKPKTRQQQKSTTDDTTSTSSTSTISASSSTLSISSSTSSQHSNGK
jgi:hypothetical protein